MKKIIFVSVVFLLASCTVSYAANEEVLSEFINNSQSLIPYEINFDKFVPDLIKNISKIKNEIFNCLESFWQNSLRCVITVVSIFIISSFFIGLLEEHGMKSILIFTVSLFCSINLFKLYNSVFENMSGTILELCDYMSLSIPSLTVFLASSGYTTTANGIQILFIYSSTILVFLMKNIILPMLNYIGIAVIVNIVFDLKEIYIILVKSIKIIKNIILIMLTIYGASMALAGFTTSVYDGITFKTAKIAVSNFVPLVGSCLSETLNVIIYSAAKIKNTAGIISVFVILFIIIKPVITSFVSWLLYYVISVFASLTGNQSISNNVELVASVISTCGSLMLYLAVVFITIIGLIISLGG